MKRPVNRLRPVHPGEVLREDYLAPLGLSVNAAISFAEPERDAFVQPIQGAERVLIGSVSVFDAQAAHAYARVQAGAQAAGNAIGFADGAIAAIATAHGFAVATRNVRDFKGTGVEVIDPWVPVTARRPPRSSL